MAVSWTRLHYRIRLSATQPMLSCCTAMITSVYNLKLQVSLMCNYYKSASECHILSQPSFCVSEVSTYILFIPRVSNKTHFWNLVDHFSTQRSPLLPCLGASKVTLKWEKINSHSHFPDSQVRPLKTSGLPPGLRLAAGIDWAHGERKACNDMEIHVSVSL